MSDDMGTFRVVLEIENPARPGRKRKLQSVLVDTGAELSWFPSDVLESLGIERRKLWHFRQADGTVLKRWTGGASVYLAGIWTMDEVPVRLGRTWYYKTLHKPGGWKVEVLDPNDEVLHTAHLSVTSEITQPAPGAPSEPGKTTQPSPSAPPNQGKATQPTPSAPSE